MRRRRRVFGRTLGPKKKRDWIILAHTTCPVVGPDPVPCEDYDAPDVNTVDSVSLIEAGDIDDKQDSLTIVRMVGEINHIVSSEWAGLTGGGGDRSVFLFQVDEAIYLAAPGEGSGESDPRHSSIMENDNVLWRRRTCFTHNLTQNTSAPFLLISANDMPDGPMGCHLDIRVMRKLRSGDELLYTRAALKKQLAGDPPDEVAWNTSFNLRGFTKF